MTTKQSQPQSSSPIEWHKFPSLSDEFSLDGPPLKALVTFFKSMTSAADIYLPGGSSQRLKIIVRSIISNVYRAYLLDQTITVENDKAAAGFAKSLVVDWPHLESIIFALDGEGFLDAEFSRNPEDGSIVRAILKPGGNLQEEFKEAKSIELNHSRPLDVHKSSEHSEVNPFVNEIYEQHFNVGNANIRKKHIKVILLDLYVAWCDDPELKIAFSRNVNSYIAGSRYNELNISKLSIKVVDQLESAGLINQSDGFLDRESGIGRTTRIWPTDALIEMFKEAKFGPFDIQNILDREVIVLRDFDKKSGKNIDVEYDDTHETNRMREVLRNYNKLMHFTFVDIPILEKNWIDFGTDKRGIQRRLHVNQWDKFTRRIFNRGSFDLGGRFWGGWWQRCPKEWRHEIFMDDQATSEIDYSGLHPALLYAQEEKDIGTDPYTIDTPEFVEDPEQARKICKLLMLVAFNAKNDKAAIQAFRSEAEPRSFEKGMSNEQLQYVLDALREKHKPISHKFASDAGIDLMNLDAQITERIIQHFTNNQIPILPIHDSYIVPFGLEHELQRQMREAFTAVMGEANITLKEETHNPYNWEPQSLEDAQSINPSSWETVLADRVNPERSKRYLHNLEQFREHVRYVPDHIYDPRLQETGPDDRD